MILLHRHCWRSWCLRFNPYLTPRLLPSPSLAIHPDGRSWVSSQFTSSSSSRSVIVCMILLHRHYWRSWCLRFNPSITPRPLPSSSLIQPGGRYWFCSHLTSAITDDTVRLCDLVTMARLSCLARVTSSNFTTHILIKFEILLKNKETCPARLVILEVCILSRKLFLSKCH